MSTTETRAFNISFPLSFTIIVAPKNQKNKNITILQVAKTRSVLRNLSIVRALTELSLKILKKILKKS